ncbi:hypothetical protein [Rubripirellula lacrimiformis]|uniref:hypothetical protein n=1 Tax=Rubripirellula lacrimiformis TaxID=1930273 RepID=UPI001C54D404|nr:hypothetical protein [Rubripirellula lacrimiformis]
MIGSPFESCSSCQQIQAMVSGATIQWEALNLPSQTPTNPLCMGLRMAPWQAAEVSLECQLVQSSAFGESADAMVPSRTSSKRKTELLQVRSITHRMASAKNRSSSVPAPVSANGAVKRTFQNRFDRLGLLNTEYKT